MHLKDLSGYTAFYDAMKALISVYESAPTAEIPSSDWVQEKLASYSADSTYLGKLSFKARIRQSGNVIVIDQAAKYRS